MSERIYNPLETPDFLMDSDITNCEHCYNKKIEYINAPCAFDIETSSFYDVNNEKTAIMYIWMLGVNGRCMVGRTWQEFIITLNSISEILQLSLDKRLIIYIHNLAYEFQFIRKHFEWYKVFALSNRKPVYAVTTTGIEFRCSYVLSGYSLEKVAEHLQKHHVKKLVGNLDYTKIRHTTTPLTQKEIDYCINDIRVVMAYISECIEQDGGINKIPLTKTGYVRRYARDNCFYSHNDNKRKSKANYKKYINHLTLTPDGYLQMKRAFQGGFTHANAYHVNRLCENVASYDFTSSYPAVMLSEKFPMSKGESINHFESKEEFEKTLKNYCCVFDIVFYGLKPRVTFENYISRSRCWGVKNIIENNGRIVQADELHTTITEQDYFIIKACYTWDNMGIANFKRFYKGYLPKPIIKSILELYLNKTTLKGVEGKEAEYLSSKEMINSVYGMMVTDIVREENIYNTEWTTSTPNLQEAINKYNKDFNRFLFYPWGVWVTAYARRNLFTGILQCADDYIYSDTDSIKILNAESHKQYFERYNAIITEKLYKMCEYYDIDKSLLAPKTIKGETKPIGVWDYEGEYAHFKTLGAKRYIVEKDKKIELTVSGLNKKIACPYLVEKYGNDIFKHFDNNLYIPKGKTGKNTHTYIDTGRHGIIKDYTGKLNEYNELSSVHLEPADYDLRLSDNFLQYIYSISFKGRKHET